MDHKSKQVYSLRDWFMTSEGSDMLTLPFTSKIGAISSANQYDCVIQATLPKLR